MRGRIFPARISATRIDAAGRHDPAVLARRPRGAGETDRFEEMTAGFGLNESPTRAVHIDP